MKDLRQAIRDAARIGGPQAEVRHNLTPNRK
jgi:hypothetical protein